MGIKTLTSFVPWKCCWETLYKNWVLLYKSFEFDPSMLTFSIHAVRLPWLKADGSHCVQLITVLTAVVPWDINQCNLFCPQMMGIIKTWHLFRIWSFLKPLQLLCDSIYSYFDDTSAFSWICWMFCDIYFLLNIII